jgi:hypothetical protein
MYMKKESLAASIAGGLLLAASLMTACSKYDYTEELQALGQRVEILEKTVFEVNTNVSALNDIIAAVQQRGYITDVRRNDDGTYTITFNTGKTYTLRPGRQGADGQDGHEAQLLISVRQDTSDHNWYWTLNGQWLLNGDDQRMRAGVTDGQDGRDGRDGASGYVIMPQMRINGTTRNWEISTDGGVTWTDTGVCADGKDGQDGQDGEDGQDGQDGIDDLFTQIVESADGKYITFILRDGRMFNVPRAPQAN